MAPTTDKIPGEDSGLCGPLPQSGDQGSLHERVGLGGQVDQGRVDEARTTVEIGDRIGKGVIEDRANLTGLGAGAQGGEVDQFQGCGADEHGAGGECGDPVGVEDTARSVRQRQVDGDEIGLGQQSVEILVAKSAVVLAVS